MSVQEKPKTLRCAVYTRVSTDHGLEQEFNSLHNQREAAEAFVKSQAHEGWTCLGAAYDDGGYSGGSMDRPALARLLDDIRAGKIDIVVVYKVDRLTRSLSDFAKLVELFDAHGVSFVSVTQAFNTTNSMGRLTLNVLLSFAQFEREVTAERIRDKIAASKKKGIRMGGPTPLGYDVKDKRLVINEGEADRVRHIFSRYLALGSLARLLEELNRDGIHTKRTRQKGDRVRGGIAFTRGPLRHLLRNRVYLGEIIHKGNYYPSDHEPIIDPKLFEAVQRMFDANRTADQQRRLGANALLKGRIFDDRGNRMTPVTARKGPARYRYYISSAVMQGRKDEAGSMRRVPAPEIERVVIAALRETEQMGQAGTAGTDGGKAGANATDKEAAPAIARATAVGSSRDAEPRAANGPAPDSEHALVEELLDRVTVTPGKLQLLLRPRGVDGVDPGETVILDWSPPNITRRREQHYAGRPSRKEGPMRPETRARLVDGIAKARLWLDQLVEGKVRSTREIATCDGCSERTVRMTLTLAFLAPEIVERAVRGELSEQCGTARLVGLSELWTEQVGCAAFS